jgi:hypothetical protein
MEDIKNFIDIDGANVICKDVLGMLHMFCEYGDHKLAIVFDDDTTNDFIKTLMKYYKIK